MTTLIHERVALARCGQNPAVIARLVSGWAVLGDVQFPRGYSLLLPDPVVGSVNELGSSKRMQFLMDMVALGDALLANTDAHRINYEIQGNREQALHAHVFARYPSEDPERAQGPVWQYGEVLKTAERFDPVRHLSLRQTLERWLQERGLVV